MFGGLAVSLNRVYGANDRIRVAGVGVGGKGFGDIEQAGLVMEVVALCDIAAQRLDKRAATWPSAKKFFDFRKLYDDMAATSSVNNFANNNRPRLACLRNVSARIARPSLAAARSASCDESSSW